MLYIPVYHPEIKKDLKSLPRNIRERIRKAIEERLVLNPLKFGKPLRYSARGYRRMRVGDYRIIYRIKTKNIIILKIGHRREVYKSFAEH